MAILLINPPRSLSDKNIWKNVTSCTPPFNLALLAAILEKEGVDCDILDSEAEKYTLEKIVDHVGKKKYDYVGITSVTATIENTLAIAKEIKAKYPGTLIILGGVHPSIFYRDLIKEDHIDYIIRNEGEKPLVRLMKGDRPDTIDNLSYKSGGQIVHNRDSEELYDLSKLPFLAYHKLPMDKYYSAVGSYKRNPSLGMITSRGCPGKCTFCYSGMFGSRIRSIPARKIVDEIVHLIDNYGIREISFYDDTFTSNRKNLIEFCNLIINEKVDITWSCFARVDTVNFEMLKLMKRAGCHQIMYGIESANENILRNINKKTDIEKNTRAVKMTEDAGINVRAMFMLGNPGETEDTINETINYAIKLNPFIVMFNITTPFPGTEMFRWARENRYLLTENWSEYDLSKPIMSLPGCDTTTLVKYYKKAYVKYYFRPRYVLKHLLTIRSLEDIRMNTRALLAIVKL